MNYLEVYSLIDEKTKFKDIYGRVRTYSINKDFHNPTISNELFKRGFRPIYKENKKIAVLISHDVDFVFNNFSLKMVLKLTIKALLKFRFISAFKQVLQWIKKSEEKKWSLRKFIQNEKELGIPATYFFLNLEKGDLDFNYNLEELKDYINEINCNGSEIAFHGGHEAYRNKKELKKQLDGFKKIIGADFNIGYRNHYLRFDANYTFDFLEEQKIKYDATLGMADNVGFRNGMCYPFRPICRITGKFLNIIEMPLNVMDVNFFKYMGLTEEISFELFKEIYGKVKSVNGVFSILWHNNNMEGDYLLLYNKIINYIASDNDAWITTHLECAEYWERNNLKEMENKLVNELFID